MPQTPATASKPPIKNAGGALYLRVRPTLLRLTNRVNVLCGNGNNNDAPTSSKGKRRRSPLYYLVLLFVLMGCLMTLVVVERASKTPTQVITKNNKDPYEGGDDAWIVKQREERAAKVKRKANEGKI
jgi:hypothetical protein